MKDMEHNAAEKELNAFAVDLAAAQAREQAQAIIPDAALYVKATVRKGLVTTKKQKEEEDQDDEQEEDDREERKTKRTTKVKPETESLGISLL